MADRASGAAWRRRQRRLRSRWRHEQQMVAAVLATVTHHSHSTVGTANAALRGQKLGTCTEVGPAEYFELSSDDGRPPWESGQRHFFEPLPRGEVAAECRHRVRNRPESRCSCAADGGTAAERHSVLCRALSKCQRSCLTEFLSALWSVVLHKLPTEPVYVLMVLASKVFSRREHSGLLSGQGSTASESGFLEEVVGNPVPQGRGGGGARGGLQDSRARQNSTAADVE